MILSSFTQNVQEYLRQVAWSLIEGSPDEEGWVAYERDHNSLWERMTEDEQSTANEIVDSLFGEWLVI